MVGKGLHSISGWFKVGLGWLFNAYSSHSIKLQGGGGIAIICTKLWRWLVPRTQGDGFASELAEIMEVAMWLCKPFLVGL
jgi:hypothetical protein